MLFSKWINPYRLLLNEYPGRLFCFDDFAGDSSSISALAAQSGEVYCEIGSGSGNHMLEFAFRRPAAAIFGFEIRFKRAVRTIQKAQARQIEHVYVLRIKGELIDRVFPAQSLAGVFVNFPDPWDRKKWQKHQILNEKLLCQMARLLAAAGFLSIKTDHPGYLERFIELVSKQGVFTPVEYTRDLYGSDYLAGNIPTEFENLFRSKNTPICYAKLIRRPLSHNAVSERLRS